MSGYSQMVDLIRGAKRIMGLHVKSGGCSYCGDDGQGRGHSKRASSRSAGGGFIMGSAFPLATDKVENIRALTDFTREYGVYKR